MKKLIQFYFTHKKLCLALMLVLAVIVVLKMPDQVFAADPTPTDPEEKDIMKSVSDIGYVILQFASMLLWPVLVMIGTLLDNDLIFGGEMGECLLGVWVQIRNIVNVVFVLVLLAVAVYNVLGLGEEGGGLPLAFKTVMPKFVLALIAVNFSFLAVKVVLDFTNVLTGAVFALPARVESTSTLRDDFQNMICGPNSDQLPLKGLWCDGKKLNERAEVFFARMDRTNIALAYAVQFGRAPNLKFVKNGLSDITQLGFNIIFNTVLYVVYALSFIALLIVLLFRVVALWIAVVLSPLMALSIVLPNLKELAGGGGELKDEFVNNAIAPIKIGLVLSIGYIMLNGFAADKGIHGAQLATSSLSVVDPNALPTDITDLQQLMIAIGVIIIVWKGVFSAADKTAAKTITGKIRDIGQEFGTFVAKLPMYAQIIPTGGKFGKDRISMESALKSIRQIPNIVDEEFGGSIWGTSQSVKNINRASNINELARAIAANPSELRKAATWEAFQSKIMELDKSVTKENFERRFGTRDQSPEKMAERLMKHDSLGKALVAVGTNERKLAQDIATQPGQEAKKEEPIKTKEDAVGALKSDREARDLERTKAFEEWTDDQKRNIDILKQLPPVVLQVIITSVDNEGRVVVDRDKMSAAVALFNALQEGTTLEDAWRAMDAATGLDDEQKKAIAKDSKLNNDVKQKIEANTRPARGPEARPGAPRATPSPPVQAQPPVTPPATTAPAGSGPTGGGGTVTAGAGGATPGAPAGGPAGGAPAGPVAGAPPVVPPPAAGGAGGR